MAKDWADIKISIKRGTHKRLKARGKMGETYDQVLTRILDELDECKK